MENLPLYTALTEFAAARPLRMHMPGHKGKPLPGYPLTAPYAIDFTELPPTGNLFDGGGAIGEAEALWAEAFHMDSCLFLTGGSTQGVLSALTLACRPGDPILLDRCCHRSAFNGLALLDLHPVFVERPWVEAGGVTGPISPHVLKTMLKTHPSIKTLCITSPTYYGVLSDIPALAQIMEEHGGVLVVDGAHGAHLPFLGLDHLSAAHLAVVSAHKTLPAPGQSALLLSNGRFSQEQLRWAASLYGSSSPSYPMMAALDLCRAYMLEQGGDAYRQTAEEVAALRRDFPALTPSHAPLDPTRLTLLSPHGFQAQEGLERQNIWPEMADGGHVVLIPTCADSQEDFLRLQQALERVELGPCPHYPPPPPMSPQVCSPRQALFAPAEPLPLDRAAGRIAAQQVAPYPPGIPVIAPGQAIEKKTIAYLEQIGYNTRQVISVAPLCVEGSR